MKLRELFEAPEKVAVAAFGRMNPPTIGHEKLVNAVKKVPGDHFLFLSHTQNPKDNPLSFEQKQKFASAFFPGITIGDSAVRTPIDMMKKLQADGYNKVVYIAGSDRVADFEKLLNQYNGKEYNFDSITVINAGARDPDAEGAEGMSASKMRAAAERDNFEEFAAGVPKVELADELFQAVKSGMIKPTKVKKMKAEEFVSEKAQGKTKPSQTNPVAKNAMASVGGGGFGQHKDKKAAMKRGKEKHKKPFSVAEEHNDTFDPKSHQYKTTMKHAKNPTVQQRMAAHDIRSGVKGGYDDRIAMLHDLERTGRLKDVDEAWGNDDWGSMSKRDFKRRELDAELGDEGKPNQNYRPAAPPPKGMYFYNVGPGQERIAQMVGLKQTKSGKWYSKYPNPEAGGKFGPGRYWEPTPVK